MDSPPRVRALLLPWSRSTAYLVLLQDFVVLGPAAALPFVSEARMSGRRRVAMRSVISARGFRGPPPRSASPVVANHGPPRRPRRPCPRHPPFRPRGPHAPETKGGSGCERAASLAHDGFPAQRPRTALLHIVAEDRRVCSHVALPRTPFVTAGPNIRETEGRGNEEHMELCCACVSSAISSAGIKAPMDDPCWTRTTIFDLGSSVCRLFPFKAL
ncbi:hypothetical protein B0H13DRAFT_2348440 [Mycena leptocephala]|nr:hypothetical protein B0H13DRAFT_2348440 [Mycena leptocephala]